MSLLKSKLFALLLALTFAGAANATTETSTSALTFSGGNAYFGNNIAAGFTAFDDFFTFSVPGANTGSIGSTVVAGITFVPVPSLTSYLTAFDLYSGTPGSGILLVPGTWLASGVMGYTGATGLASGSYFLNVKGTLPGAPLAGGSYAGNANLVLTPVPEPGEWALMMSGLGLIGFMLRRRTRNTA